jgi:ABC-type antimicrobial peptide transport system permease subunit
VKFGEYFLAAFNTLWANRTRSILTMIGIVIGTAAVISIFALGQSAKSSIGQTLGVFGDQGLFLFPDQSSRRFNAVQFTWTDYENVLAGCSRCAKVFPVYDTYYSVRNGHTKDVYELSSDTDYVMDKLPLAEGRRFNSDDVEGARNVCNLEWGLKQKLFGDSPAVGKFVRVAGRRFLVVGVFANLSAGVFNPVVGSSDSLTIPYSTFHRLPDSQVLGLQLYTAPGSTSAEAIDDAENILKRAHPKASFQSFDSSQQGATFLQVIGFVAIGISVIGAIALVVGGIGVMNIMLVSVMERTREIGIHKAIGASRGDILWQFLTEAVAITLVGGGIGTVVGVLTAVAGSSLIDISFAGVNGGISWFPIIALALGSSLAIGLFFGTWPAVRASKLEPIECLRHE